MSVINVVKEWQTLVAAVLTVIAALFAACIAWNAYRATVRQVHLTELSQARREEEEALRDFEALKSSIRRFALLRKEMVALDSAKTKGTEKLEWWQIYSGWHDRGLLAVDDRETVVAGHPSIDLERAAKVLQTRMNGFLSVFHRDVEAAKDKSGPPQDIRARLEAYAHSEFGAAAIKQLESDMYDLRMEFIRAFNECENKGRALPSTLGAKTRAGKATREANSSLKRHASSNAARHATGRPHSRRRQTTLGGYDGR